MTRELIIMDYLDRKTTIKVNDFENVKKITNNKLSGDDVVTILRNDYSEETHDSSNDRIADFDDGTTVIYDKQYNIDKIDSFNKRQETYDEY